MPDLSKCSFSAAPEEHEFAGLLFDMDGTIIDSTPAIEKYWGEIGARIGVDAATILKTAHGRRSIDTLEILAPQLANWEFVCAAEGRVPKEHGSDAVEIPGARDLLASLSTAGVPWAIVTSGTRPLVQGWIERMGLAQPEHLVTAEQVSRGKPDPAAYLLGAQRLGLLLPPPPAAAAAGDAGDDVQGSTAVKAGGEGGKRRRDDMLVLEDAPSGVLSGKAAGFLVVALATSHEVGLLREAGADWVVRDMRSVVMKRWDEGSRKVTVGIRDALVV